MNIEWIDNFVCKKIEEIDGNQLSFSVYRKQNKALLSPSGATTRGDN